MRSENVMSTSEQTLTVEAIEAAVRAIGPIPPRLKFKYSKMLDEFDTGFLLGKPLTNLQVWAVPEAWRAKLEAEGVEEATEMDIHAATLSFDWMKVVATAGTAKEGT